MRHVERDSGPGAEQRDTVLRTVIFAFVSLAAWWGCSNVASADEAPPATPPAGDGEGLRAIVEMLGGSGGVPAVATPELRTAGNAAAMGPQAPVVVSDPPEVVGPGPIVVSDPPEAFGAGPAVEAENGLMAGVVVPLVTAVQPALAPVGELVDPTLAAVTTPLAPLVQTVVPVVDRVVGPVLGPVVTPLVVQVVAPVVEQASTAIAPVVELVAPVLVPVARPVVALVAPVVGQLTAALAAPVVAVVHPALRAVDGPGSRVNGLRPATVAFADGRGASLPATPGVPPAAEPADPTDGAPHSGAVRRVSVDRGGEGAALESPAAPAAATAEPDRSGGLPFRPAVPGRQAAVMTQSGADTSQRTQRLVAVLAPSPGVPAARLSSLSGSPAGSPPARSGGRPPVTPD